MINITKKSNCCGCSACVQRCPKKCIIMKEDEEGFLYPLVDSSKCINCNLCEKVCPLINNPEKVRPIKVLAVKNCNEEERMASSSGGIFIALAKKVIEKGGVVFGAAFDKNWEVVHVYSETIEGVIPMMGSKYVQSRIGDSYYEAENFLKSGRIVLFTGTPCQITGLHNFLHKEYSNLLSVDCLCHGVPSPGIWSRYLNEELNLIHYKFDREGTIESSSFKSMISNINFRNKSVRGWRKFSFVIQSISKSKENSFLLSEFHKDNTFMKGFLSNVYLRPCCHKCKCKNGVSHSDLTLADFWGIDLISPEFYDDKGVSLVLVNSEKGKTWLSFLNVDILTSSLTVAKRLNGGFKEKTFSHPKRKKFFEKINKCESIINLINECSMPTLKFRIFNKINYIKQKLIKLNH